MVPASAWKRLGARMDIGFPPTRRCRSHARLTPRSLRNRHRGNTLREPLCHQVGSHRRTVFRFEIVIEDDVYVVKGAWIKKIFNSTNFEDTESLNFFQRTLEGSGVFDELRKLGVKEGDTVRIEDLEFDFFD